MRRGAALAFALLAGAACRTPSPTWQPLPPDDPRPAHLLARWAEAAGALHGLRGRARLAVDGQGGSLRLRGRQRLALERPGRLRVEILGLLDQTVAVLVTDGQRFEVFRAGDHSYESGPVHPGLLWQHAWIALTPEEAIELLLGGAARDASLAIGGAAADAQGRVRVDLVDGAGRRLRRVDFDGAGRLRALEAFGAAGGLLWRAGYDGYASVGGVSFAHDVRLEMGAGDTRAEIRLSDLELNPELPPDIFRLREPAGSGGGGRG